MKDRTGLDEVGKPLEVAGTGSASLDQRCGWGSQLWPPFVRPPSQGEACEWVDRPAHTEDTGPEEAPDGQGTSLPARQACVGQTGDAGR
jgi:hypothetical protein